MISYKSEIVLILGEDKGQCIINKLKYALFFYSVSRISVKK